MILLAEARRTRYGKLEGERTPESYLPEVYWRIPEVVPQMSVLWKAKREEKWKAKTSRSI